MATTSPYIAVAGPGLPEQPAEDLAFETGRLLAQAGAVLICGGLAASMESACRGAREGGGITVGILPGTSRAEANPHVDIAIPTGLGEARNALIVRSCDGLIAVGGGFGTLSEIGLALKLGKPVVGLNTWELSKEGRAVDGVLTAESPEDAVELVLGLVLDPAH